MRLVAKLLGLALICSLLYWALHIMSEPSVGSVGKPSSRTSDTSNTPVTRTTSNLFARFQYPAVFQELKPSPPVAPIIAVHDFSKPGVTNSWHLTVQIKQLANGSLDDDGTYHMRQLDPGRFTRQDTTSGSKPVVIFTDNAADSGFTQSAYVQNGSLGAAITVTGNSGESTNLKQALQTVLDSWQWL